MDERPTLGIVGAGKVGSVLARLCYTAGYRVQAIYSPNIVHANELSAYVDGTLVTSASAVVDAADLTLLTVPDDRIEIVAAGLDITQLRGKAIVHTSGAYDLSTLVQLAEHDAMIGSLHPVYPFADVETAMRNLHGATFGVEVSVEPLRTWLYQLVGALNGRVLTLLPGQKATYHAALAIASNYVVTLYAVAEGLLTGLGADRAVADHALDTLVGGTADNLSMKGIPDALTGPLVRGDVGTIVAHLQALRQIDPELVTMYQQLARLSFPMLRARGVLPEAIETILRQE